MIKLDTQNFHLQLKPMSMIVEDVGANDRYEWMTVRVCLTAPGIQVEYDWEEVTPADFQNFQQQLESMHEQLLPGQRAELTGMTAGFSLVFDLMDLGHVKVTWQCRPIPSETLCAQGSVEIDQSFLPQMIRETAVFFADFRDQLPAR